MKFFLIGALANTSLMLGAIMMVGMLGDTGFTGMSAALASGKPSPVLLLGTVLVMVGLSYKLGAAPAHAWMPDVAEGAPAPSAAFLTVVPKIGAAIMLARLVSLFPLDTAAIRPLVAALALITMTIGNLAALWQDDLRRMLGWSSVSQSGHASAWPHRSRRFFRPGQQQTAGSDRHHHRALIAGRHPAANRLRRQARTVPRDDRGRIHMAGGGRCGQHGRLAVLLPALHRTDGLRQIIERAGNAWGMVRGSHGLRAHCHCLAWPVGKRHPGAAHRDRAIAQMILGC